ncbi:MAG: tyrosine-type recombinase/integrase [Candidatus Tectomicrobia bacterium]|nr:tyrosine-type recombinase/integrase [Candidatus Tectomicrobia bacterium]
MHPYIELFKQHLVEKGASPHTIVGYLSDLKQLQHFLERPEIAGKESAQVKPDFEKVEKSTLEAFLHHLSTRNKSHSAVARRLSTLKTFFRFLHREGYCSKNPAHLMTLPRATLKSRYTPDCEELFKLLAVPQGESPLLMRDRALIETLYATGLRPGELVGLDVQHLDLRGEVLRLEKNGKARTIPLEREAKESLQVYLLKREATDGPLFLNHRGGRLTVRGVEKIIDRYARQEGLSLRITPRLLRESRTLHLLKGGADLHVVQEWLGYKHLGSIQRYADQVTENLMEVYMKAHPRALRRKER